MSKNLLLRDAQNSNHLHIVLREQMRDSFARQPLGERVASERALAREFGVSTATVSRALQELQQEGILQRIPGKGTFLSLPATTIVPESGGPAAAEQENLAAHQAVLNAWVVVLLDLYEPNADRSSEFWPQRIVSRLEYLIGGGGGKAKITVASALSEEEFAAAWQAAKDVGVNCVFFIVDERTPLADASTEALVSRHIGAGVGEAAPAVVQISLAAMQQPYFDTVSFDGQWGAYLATSHLLSLGHRSIAFLAPDAPFSWLSPRIAGFHHALRGMGIAVPRDNSDFGVIRVPQGSDGTGKWQQLGQDAADLIAANASLTAVLATNDQMALAFIERTRSLGRSIPESLSVVGYDDWFTSAIHGLTTVHPPIDEMADAALHMAKQQMAEGAARGHTHLFLKPTLMVRNSTQAPKAPPE